VPFQEHIQMVRSTREKTLSLVAALSQQELDYAPAPGKWSPGEILDHLILSDQVYYGEITALFDLKKAGKPTYLRRGFADFNPSIFFIPKSALPYLDTAFNAVNLVLPRALRTFFIISRLIPTEAPDIAAPRPGRSAEALRRELENGPPYIEALFMQTPDADFGKFVHYHPLLGENDIYQMLRFLVNHEKVHQKQLKETVSAVRR